MAYQHYYIDSSIGGYTGLGTKADPYGSLDYAFEQNPTLPVTTINVFNIKNATKGSPEVVTSGLPTGGTVSAQGLISPYVTDEFDTTGLAYLDFGTGQYWTDINLDWFNFKYIHFSGGDGPDGYRLIGDLDNNINFYDCVFRGSYIIGDNSHTFERCKFLDMRPTANFLRATSAGRVLDCFFEISGNSVTSDLIRSNSVNGCVFVIDGSTNDCIGNTASVANWQHNTFYYKNGSTGNRRAMEVDDVCTCQYNYIEGAGQAFRIQSACKHFKVQNNVLFNVSSVSGGDINAINTAEIGGVGANTITLGSSALTDPENGDFSLTQDYKDQIGITFIETNIADSSVTSERYAGSPLGFPAGSGGTSEHSFISFN